MEHGLCDRSLPRPRVHIYEIPRTVVPAPTAWRNVRGLYVWLLRSRFYEANPRCADYFLINSHPVNREGGVDVGDVRMMQLFDYVRHTWPFFNHSLRHGTARHFMLLPCDHGPGDCAFSRPIVPNKYSPGHQRNWGNPMLTGGDEIEHTARQIPRPA